MSKTTKKPQKKTLLLIDEVNTVIKENPVTHITLRQIYYRLISKGLLKNCRADNVKLSVAVVKGRKLGLIPIDKIIDTHRPRVIQDYHYNTSKDFFEYRSSYDVMKDFLTDYQVPRWYKQPKYVEVWSEKDALTTLFEDITTKFEVSYIVTKGNASFTILLEASKRIKEECKKRNVDEATILYFGDYDPSGKMIPKAIKKELENLETSIDFVNVALTKEQINHFNLPLIDLNKKDNNTKWFIKNYGDMGCELDALKPEDFQQMVEQAILKYFDVGIYKQVENNRQEDIKKITVETEKLLVKMNKNN